MLCPAADALDLPAVLRTFATDGYARLGQVLTEEAAVALGLEADAILGASEPVPGIFYQPASPTGAYEDLVFGAGWQGPTQTYRKLERLENNPMFAAWIGNALFARLAHLHLGPGATLYRSVLWNKPASGGMAVPWHQDDGRFWGLDRAPSLQVWTALDPAGEQAGCLEVVPGSHLDGLATEEGGTLLPEHIREREAHAVKLPAARGECILVHNHLWHRTATNYTTAPRKALSVSFLSADTQCLRRKRRPRTFKPAFGP